MKKPLLWAFLTGAALILVIRLALPNLGGAIAAALAAVAIVWWLGSYYTANKVKQRDRAGDDLYYLGLLLTLISMIYALVSLFTLPDAGDVQARVDALIGYFGIALLSTVAGILGRILLQDSFGEGLGPTSTGTEGLLQDSSGEGLPPTNRRTDGLLQDSSQRPDPTTAAGEDSTHRKLRQKEAQYEQETLLNAETREAVANMMQLRRDLREAADAFAHFTRVTLSHADHIKSHTQQLLEDFNQHMAALAERGLDDTGVAWQRVGEAMRTDGDRLLHRINSAVSATAERTENAWRSLVEQSQSAVAAARERLDADAAEMERMLQRLEMANGSLEALANALDGAQIHVSTLSETVSSAAATLNASAAETVAVQRTQAESVKASQIAALESFETTTTALREAVDKQVAEQSLAWQKVVDDFKTAGQAHQERSEQAMATTRRTIDALIASLVTAEQEIAALGRSASGAAETAESHTAKILATLGALAEGARQQQEASLQTWRETASRFSVDTREHLTREMDAWREVLDGFNTAESTRRLSEETSRLGNLIKRLDGLLKRFDRYP